MNIQGFRNSQDCIEREIEDNVRQHSFFNDAIFDGVADLALYLKSSPKVAWILKEPYDDFENGIPSGGGWSIPRDCFMKEDQEWKVRTWQRVIYVMYGLANNLRYSQMDYIKNDPDMGKVLRAVAWINLSKMPAYSTSSITQITNQYKNFWRPIVQKQLDLYSPDVIVFGNTLQCCREDFLSENDVPLKTISYNNVSFINIYKKEHRVLLDAFHPAFRNVGAGKGSIEFYVDSLIEAIRNYNKY